MDILRPKYELVKDITDPAEQLRQLEKHSVMTSLENLMTFPWLEEKVSSGELTLHGMWTDIAEGGLEYYNPSGAKFESV
jgi:carbonic anhydrase